MCGITGYFNYRSGAPARPEVIRAMTASLEHRGPDEGDCLVDGSIALGIRRLRVIDAEGGRQPVSNETGTVHVVFNGEIYNHSTLRAQLQAAGHQFRSRSDTEVIAHAYEEWGTGCVEWFNGMFAFAVWDVTRQRLLLARDRLGIKPLYVYQGADGVVFGSELKAVLTAPWVPLTWNLEAIDSFMAYEYVPAPHSIVDGVQKLPPATVALFSRDRTPVTQRFWRLEARAEETDPGSAGRRLRENLSASVKRRLVADVPVGAFLSGGVDSTAIVALASEADTQPVQTFTIGFADATYDERAYARIAASRFGTHHHERLIEPAVVELAERLSGHLDEPFGDVSIFPTYLVSKHARESVTVALSGDGGDELFAGYDQHKAHRWAMRLRWLTRGWPWKAVERFLDQARPQPSKKGIVNVAKRFTDGLRLPSDLEHARWWVFAGPRERRALLSAETLRSLSDHDPLDHYRQRLREGAAAGFRGLQCQLYADVTGYLPDDILTKVDRMSMAVSLEARVPFLDHEMVEHAMTIPDRWKLHRGKSKWILKRALKDVLPPEIAFRSKQGFSVPMKNWLRGPLKPMLLELTADERIRDRGWFEPVEVRRLVNEHLSGRRNNAHQLWCLLALELSHAHLTALVANRRRLAHNVA